MKLELEKKYRFTLVSKRVVDVIVHGTLGKGLDISVDGNRGVYVDLDTALGEPFTHVNPGLTFQSAWASACYALRTAEWLERSIFQAEENDPQLKRLKDAVNAATDKVKNAEEHEVPECIRQQNEAIKALLYYVSSK